MKTLALISLILFASQTIFSQFLDKVENIISTVESNKIPQVGISDKTIVYTEPDSSAWIQIDAFNNGLITFYSFHPRTQQSFAVVNNSDTLYLDTENRITNNYKSEFYIQYNYLILSKYHENNLVHSKGYYLGEDIVLQNYNHASLVTSGQVLSDSKHGNTYNDYTDINWIQFYDSDNVRRVQLIDPNTQQYKNIEFYRGNKVGIIQTYHDGLAHIDSVFSREGELIDVYEFDANNTLISEPNRKTDRLMFMFFESEYAWDFFYPHNHTEKKHLENTALF
ncbi:MAG: hypothetical protein MI922_14705 [Bacteroidales bacterium]|nr:hypothetical protein [Bacteroidales bacterium]